jgi:heptaprenyl diphosphate synthase
MSIRKLTRLAIYAALAIVLSIIESIVPFFNGLIPGLKIGLANIIIVGVLYKYSFKDTFLVSILRVVVVGILRTGLFSITTMFSLTGAIMSLICMYIAKKLTKLSIIGISILGSVGHTLGQILFASFFMHNIKVLYYMPWLLIFSIITGIFVGIISRKILDRINDF